MLTDLESQLAWRGYTGEKVDFDSLYKHLPLVERCAQDHSSESFLSIHPTINRFNFFFTTITMRNASAKTLDKIFFLKLEGGLSSWRIRDRTRLLWFLSVGFPSPPFLARQLHVNNRNYFFSLFFFRPLHSIMHYTSVPRIYIYLFIREKEIWNAQGGWVYISNQSLLLLYAIHLYF